MACCQLVVEFSVGVRAIVTGLSLILFFFSTFPKVSEVISYNMCLHYFWCKKKSKCSFKILLIKITLKCLFLRNACYLSSAYHLLLDNNKSISILYTHIRWYVYSALTKIKICIKCNHIYLRRSSNTLSWSLNDFVVNSFFYFSHMSHCFQKLFYFW